MVKMIQLKQHVYLYSSIPLLEPHYTLEELLELAQALHGKECIGFSECLYHVLKYIKCCKPDALKALYDFIQTSIDRKLNSIPVDYLLLVLFQYTFAPIESNQAKDFYAQYSFYAIQWKKHFQEFSCIMALYLNGPSYLEEFKASKTCSIPWNVYETTMSLLFFNTNQPKSFLDLFKEWSAMHLIFVSKETKIESDKMDEFINETLNSELPMAIECEFSENGFCKDINQNDSPSCIPCNFISYHRMY